MSRIVRGTCVDCGNSAHECECELKTQAHEQAVEIKCCVPTTQGNTCGYCLHEFAEYAESDGWPTCPACGGC